VHLVEAPDVVPGGSFRIAPLSPAAVVGPVRVELAAGDRVPASLATPLIATMLTARARRFAVTAVLTLTGEPAGAIPIFRDAVLRDPKGDEAGHRGLPGPAPRDLRVRRRREHGLPSGYGCAGTVNVKVEPLPISLVTQIRPPCSSTNFLVRVSPSPVPSCRCAPLPT